VCVGVCVCAWKICRGKPVGSFR